MSNEYSKKPDKIVVLGASAGGIHAAKVLLKDIPADAGIAWVLILHRLKNVSSKLLSLLESYTSLPVKEIQDKDDIEANTVYLTPANYHALFDEDYTFSLDVSELVNYSRPSIDVGFISLAQNYGTKGVGVLLTGANADGAQGLKVLFENKGACIVQEIESAQVKVMPQSGLDAVPMAAQLKLEDMVPYILKL